MYHHSVQCLLEHLSAFNRGELVNPLRVHDFVYQHHVPVDKCMYY